MADSMDEFEFKPLTEGLGFHKKAENSAPASKPVPLSIQLSSPTNNLFSRPLDAETDEENSSLSLSDGVEDELLGRESSRERSQSISELIASLPPSLDFVDEKTEAAPALADERPQIFQPLAREDYKQPTLATPTIVVPSAATSTGVLPAPGTKAATAATAGAAVGTASGYRGQLDESYSRSFPHLERRKEIRQPMELGLEPVACHFGAGILDAMVVTGVGTILLVCILLITQVNLVGLLSNAQTDGPTQIHIALLFLTVLQLYMLTARSFAGSTLGEWAFDLQMGTNENQKRAVYPLQVAWRTLLGTVTGIVLLPLLSLIFRRDLQKHLCGLQLFHKP